MNKILILSFTFSLLFLTNLSGQKQKSIFSFPKIEKLDLTTEQSKSLSKHTRNENFLDYTFVKIGDIENYQDNGVITFMLPNNREIIQAKANLIESYEDGSFLWSGDLVNKDGTIILQKESGGIFGRVTIGDEIYSILDFEDKLSLIAKSDKSKLSRHICFDIKDDNIVNLKQDNQNSNKDLKSMTCTTPVRIAVYFTPEAAASTNVSSLSSMGVTDLNISLNNVGIPFSIYRFELAAVRSLPNFNQTNNVGDDLREFIRIGELNDLRGNLQADLAILLTNSNYGDNNGNTIFGAAFNNALVNETRAYGIVEVDANTSRKTFAHEVAHIMGLKHHDDDVDDLAHSPFYARGFFTDGMPTIASGGQETRHNYFSTDGLRVNGNQMGTPWFDANRHLRETVCRIANLNPYNPFHVSISGPTFGYENVRYTWRASAPYCSGRRYRWEVSINGFNYYTVSNSSRSYFEKNAPK